MSTCQGCGRAMAKVPRRAKVPTGYVRFHGNGRCTTCNNRQWAAQRPGGAKSVRTVEDNRRHLEAWLRDRRARGVPENGLVIA